MTNPARTAGPNGDGSQSLAKESKVATMVQMAFTLVVTGALGWLTHLDTSHWSGFLGEVGVAAVAALVGLLAAYRQSNT